MEDDRGRFGVIVAGYEEPMERFIRANPGLRSRFTKTIAFPDYSPDELTRILLWFAATSGYELAPIAHDIAARMLATAWLQRDESFGNARTVRNLFEECLHALADRVSTLAAVDDATLSTLEAEDVLATPLASKWSRDGVAAAGPVS